MKDYYKVLGVPRNATAAQIKQAFRKLVKACHPDLNSSAKAAEWTRELNEAHDILSDPHKRMSYDTDLKLDESDRKKTDPAQQSARNSSRAETNAPKSEPNYDCDICARSDPSLRICAFWRVFSFISYSEKSPIVKILCAKCRVKQSLVASAYTICIGWWSILGVFWTLQALVKNALGGDQPKENNAALLNALGYQFYRAGRLHDAYESLVSAFKLKPNARTEEGINILKPHFRAVEKKSIWQRFYKFELPPLYYHAPAAAVIFVTLLFWFGTFGSNSGANSPGVAQSSTPPLYQRPQNAVPSFVPQNPPQIARQPAFNEPEEPMPQNGTLVLNDNVYNYTGTTAPLKIATRASDGNYVVKVVDWYSGEFVGMYFINSGGSLNIELPLGTYKLKFASGKNWYGINHLFGPATRYSYVPDKMDFYISGDYARGHEIELIPQVGGNLETPRMRPEDW